MVSGAKAPVLESRSSIQSPGTSWRGYLRKELILRRLWHLHASKGGPRFVNSPTLSELKCWANRRGPGGKPRRVFSVVSFELGSEPGRRLIRRGRCYLHHEVLRENRSRAGGRKNVEGRRPDSFVEEQHVRWAAFSYASERRGCFYQRV